MKNDKMSADIGTRKGAKICDVVEGSSWISGLAWISKPESDFPTLTIDDIELSKSDLDESENEIFTIKPNEKNMSLYPSFYRMKMWIKKLSAGTNIPSM